MRAHVASAIPLLSASQISLYRECARKWAFRYIAKIQTPQHPAAALGTEVDDTQLQPYLRDGRPFDYTRNSGYIAVAGLAYLPKPQTPGMEVQKHFILPSPFAKGEFAYQGYIDLWLPDSAPVPDMPGGAPFVGDFKTTSDLKWAKGEAALRVDVQAMLYATYAIYETGKNAVDLSWMYFQTRGPRKTKRTYLRVQDDEVLAKFKNIEATAGEIFAAKSFVTDPLTLPPSPSQCEAYGGCPFRDKCNLSPVDHLEALASRDMALTELQGLSMGSSTNDLMANLRARKAGAQGAGSSPVGEVSAASTLGPAPSLPPSALGINPPEKDLPPPPPVAAVKKPGRPPKPKAPVDPLGADVHAAVSQPPAGAGGVQLNLPYTGARAVESLDYDALAEAIVGKLGKFFAQLAKASQ